MEAEHCYRADSHLKFQSHYGIIFTPFHEWQLVVGKEILSDIESEHGRRVQRVDEMMELSIVKRAQLAKSEVIAAHLFSACMVSPFAEDACASFYNEF